MKCTLAVVLIIVCSFGCKKLAEEALTSENDLTITGQWKTRDSCVFMGTNTYVKGTTSFSESGTFNQKFDVYTNPTCLNFSYIKEITGTFVLSSNATSGGTVSGYLNIDSTLTTYEITPASAAAAAALNNANFCGFNNWVNSVKKSVAGRTCSSIVLPGIGATEYSILQKYFQDYSVIYPPGMPLKPPDETYYRGDLMMGTSTSGKDGKTLERRHTTIQNNFALMKQ